MRSGCRGDKWLVGCFGALTVLAAGELAAQPDIVAGFCSNYRVSPTATTVLAGGGSGTFHLEWDWDPPPEGECITDCSYDSCGDSTGSVQSSASWLSSTRPFADRVDYTAGAHTGTSNRTGTLTVAGATFTVTQEGVPRPPACTFTVAPASREVADDAGQYNVHVTASRATCSWSMSSHASWITVATPSRTGTTTGTYRTDSNTIPGSPQRTGTMTVAGHTVTITQRRGPDPPRPDPPRPDPLRPDPPRPDPPRPDPPRPDPPRPDPPDQEPPDQEPPDQEPPVSCPVSPIRVQSPSPVRIPDTGQTFVIGVADASDCSWPVTDDQEWIIPNRSTISGRERVAITVQPNNRGDRSGTVRVGERRIRVVQEERSRLTENRDGLLRDWAPRTEHGTDVCRAWDNLPGSAREVFIWNTHRLHLVDMGDSKTMLDHVDRLYAIYGKDGNECGGIEYNRTFMSMTTEGMNSALQDKLLAASFGNDSALPPWRESRDHACRFYSLGIGECPHRPFHDTVETDIRINDEDKEPGAQLHFFGRRDLVVVRRHFYDGMIPCAIAYAFVDRNRVCMGDDCRTPTGPSTCPMWPRYEDTIVSDPTAPYTRGPKNSQQYDRVTIADAYSFEMDQDYGGRNNSAPSCLLDGAPMTVIYSRNYGDPRWNWQPSACHDRLSSGFTDQLVASATHVRKLHVTELRNRIDALRDFYALSPFSWTDESIVPGVTPIKALHLTELRSALAEAYTAAKRDTPMYTDSTIVARRTPIRSVHLLELQRAVLALEE